MLTVPLVPTSLGSGVFTPPHSLALAPSDTTAPILTLPTGVKTGQTTATLGVTTNEGNGTLYVVSTTSSTPPSKSQVKTGKDNGGATAAFASSQAISSTGQRVSTPRV
jgi:hypothetical protein